MLHTLYATHHSGSRCSQRARPTVSASPKRNAAEHSTRAQQRHAAAIEDACRIACVMIVASGSRRRRRRRLIVSASRLLCAPTRSTCWWHRLCLRTACARTMLCVRSRNMNRAPRAIRTTVCAKRSLCAMLLRVNTLCERQTQLQTACVARQRCVTRGRNGHRSRGNAARSAGVLTRNSSLCRLRRLQTVSARI